jgi:hypothetical protein
MIQPDFQTVFEIGRRSFPWGGLLHPVPFIALGILLFRFARGKEVYQLAGIIGAMLATLFLLIAVGSFVPDFIHLRRAYRSGDSSVIIGTVENFHPAPALGAANESFSVKGAIFSYNVLDANSCFHNAPAHKGPIRPGLEVRIYYKNGCIQRVDIHQ